VPAATWRLVIGLTAMFVLAPSTRFGYFIYPAAMMLWMYVSKAGRKTSDPAGAEGQAPDPPPPAPAPAPPAPEPPPIVAATG
jgi:hypothetical protein